MRIKALLLATAAMSMASEGNASGDALSYVDDIRGLVASGDVVLATERAKFKAAKGRDTTLDDEALIRAIAIQEDDTTEDLVAAILKTEGNGAGPVVARTVSASSKEGEAKALAMRADNDANLSDNLTRVHKSKTWLAYSARVIQLDLRRIYGDEMNGWPIIGAVSHLTTDGKVDKTKPTGHPNPDGYLRPTRRKNSSRMALAYWSDAMSENLKPIRDIRDQLQASKDNPQAMNPLAREQHENKLSKQIEAMKAKVRAAIRLDQQLALAAAYPACKVVWEMHRVPVLDEKGNAVMDPTNPKRAKTMLVEAEAENPISVEDSDPQVKDWRLYSIVQFNNLDFEEATAKGATYKSLIATAQREPAGDDDDGFLVDTIEDMRKAVNVLASFVMDRTNKHAILKELVNLNDDNAEMLVSMADIVQTFRPLVEANVKAINAARERLDNIVGTDPKTGTNG